MIKIYSKAICVIGALLAVSMSYAQYCTPAVSASATSFLNNLKLSTTSDATGDLLNRPSSNVGYENITDTDIVLISNTAYTFNFGVGDPTLAAYKRIHVWIDMNGDGDFEDDGELTFSWSAANQSADLKFSNKNIGPVIVEGETRMRVAMVASDAAIDAISPCDGFSGGEVEDYKISLYLTPPPAYCQPTVPASTTSYINNLKVSTTSEATGDLLNRSSTNTGYEYITDSGLSLMSNTAYTFNLGVADAALTSNKRVHVWIDMNGDGDFMDAGELMFSWTGANVSSDLKFSNKNIGPVVVAGPTRMRVAMVASDAAIDPISPCDDFSGGEVEDYKITLQVPDTSTCDATSMTASTTSFINYMKITEVTDGDMLNHTSGNVGYENITDSNVPLTAEQSYRFNFGIGNPGGAANKRVHIWIDKNQDGDFIDAGEEIFNWTGANTTADLQFSGKSIGAFSVLGSTTMRVAMRSSDSTIPSLSPCEAFTDGEVEDYAIVVQAAIPPFESLTAEVEHDLFVGDQVAYSTNGTPHTYRIPSLVTTTSGTLLAITDARYENASDVPGDIDLQLRRSTDNGTTWGSAITINTVHGGDACTVVDKETGRIFIFYAYSEYQGIFGSNGDPDSPNTLRSQYVYSDDDGLTWSAPVDLTAALYKSGDKSYWASAGTGIQLRNGTLVIPIGVVRAGNEIYGALIYSTDHGATWNRSATNSFNRFDENTIVELNDGRIMINSRNHYGTGRRLVTYTSDLGTTWEPYSFDAALIDPICQGNIIRYTSTLDGYEKDRILFSNPASTSGRKNGALRISYDEGQTWAHTKLYQPGFSAYSSTTILQDGKIGLLYESDNYTKIKFKRFSLEDLTDNTDSFKALSVNDLKTSNKRAMLYPNPVKNRLHLGITMPSEVKIYNMVGKLVYKEEVSLERKTMDVSFLNNGLYFINIKNDSGIHNFKIIKN